MLEGTSLEVFLLKAAFKWLETILLSTLSFEVSSPTSLKFGSFHIRCQKGSSMGVRALGFRGKNLSGDVDAAFMTMPRMKVERRASSIEL